MKVKYLLFGIAWILYSAALTCKISALRGNDSVWENIEFFGYLLLVPVSVYLTVASAIKLFNQKW